MNPLWIRIHWFICSTMIRDGVISDHRSWSGSSQRNAPFGFHKFPKAFVDVISHAKPKSAFFWGYLHQDLWSKATWNIETRHDPRHLLVCSLLSFIVFIEGWWVAWVASVSARVLYENGHSQESLVPLISTSFPWCPVVVATSTPLRIGHTLFSRGFVLCLFIKLCEQMHVKSE